jgi:hypothetical protein
MHNVQELERQWLRYKVKFYMPFAIGSLIFLIVLLVIIFFPENKSTQDTSIPSTALPIQATQPVSNKPINSNATASLEFIENQPSTLTAKQNTPSIQHEKISDPSVVLEPSLNFIDNIEEAPFPEVEIADSRPIANTKPDAQLPVFSKPVETKDFDKKQIIQSDITTPKEDRSISIDTHEDAQDIIDVLERFKKNKKPALSLFAAKRYYALEQYTNAYNYALITNELDSTIEESWLIAAKSLVKMQKKDDAIRLLNTFIKSSHSMRAKMLLDQINNDNTQ